MKKKNGSRIFKDNEMEHIIVIDIKHNKRSIINDNDTFCWIFVINFKYWFMCQLYVLPHLQLWQLRDNLFLKFCFLFCWLVLSACFVALVLLACFVITMSSKICFFCFFFVSFSLFIFVLCVHFTLFFLVIRL